MNEQKPRHWGEVLVSQAARAQEEFGDDALEEHARTMSPDERVALCAKLRHETKDKAAYRGPTATPVEVPGSTCSDDCGWCGRCS